MKTFELKLALHVLRSIVAAYQWNILRRERRTEPGKCEHKCDYAMHALHSTAWREWWECKESERGEKNLVRRREKSSWSYVLKKKREQLSKWMRVCVISLLHSLTIASRNPRFKTSTLGAHRIECTIGVSAACVRRVCLRHKSYTTFMYANIKRSRIFFSFTFTRPLRAHRRSTPKERHQPGHNIQ